MLRVESVSISAFRGIREGSIAGLADVNVLVGRNNSGKSTVAEAMSRSTQTQDPLRRRTCDLWDHVRQDRQQELVFRGDPALTPTVEMKLGLWRLGGDLRANPTLSPSVPPPPVTEASHSAYSFAQRITVFRPPDAFDAKIEALLWPEILRGRRDKALVGALNDIAGGAVEQLQLLPDARMMLLYPQHSLTLDVQGDGMRAALRCLMVLSVLKQTLFVLEEPESHQHPGSLAHLASAVCKLAREHEVQLLVTTHSLECVSAFLQATDEAARAAAGQDAKGDSAVFHLKLADGQLEVRRLDAEAVKGLLDTGVDVRKLDLYV
ncbi:MAG: AAA family ATPase [Deltaproteobacteria bacterium]|nr:AAA family ATPase [Deltaproteobacteria bacterium]